MEESPGLWTRGAARVLGGQHCAGLNGVEADPRQAGTSPLSQLTGAAPWACHSRRHSSGRSGAEK